MNARTARDKALNLASLAMLDYLCSNQPDKPGLNKLCYRPEIIQRKIISGRGGSLSVNRERTADGRARKGPAEEVPSSTGKDEPGNPARREPWQGPRNDTVPVTRMTRLTATFPEIW